VKKFNCAPKLKHLFYIPTRNHLLPILEDLSKDVVNSILPINELVDKIGEFIGSRFRVDVLHAQSPQVSPGDMNVNAEYDEEKDQKGRISIEIILITHPLDDTYLWDQEAFDVVAKRIADTLVHELAHMHQARARDFEPFYSDIDEFDTDKEQAQHYLGHFDEIDAYARNIASELIDSQSYMNIHPYLERPSCVTLEASVNLWAYMNTFDKDVQNPAIRRLLKKVYKHYQSLSR
jgi:hypothetical protein